MWDGWRFDDELRSILRSADMGIDIEMPASWRVLTENRYSRKPAKRLERSCVV